MLFGGFICQQLEWEFLFYLCGGLCVIWCIFWQTLIFPTPEEDPRCSQEERDFIAESLGKKSYSDKKSCYVPWRKILSSMPVIVLVIAQLCCQWIIYLIFSLFPSFIKSVFDLNVQTVGLIAAIPAISCISAGRLHQFKIQTSYQIET